jgi:TfoX/Sxy family transcriptional regulator of competence genes
MARDEAAEARFRDALAGLEGVSEKRMMGGMCFFLDGNMLGGADRPCGDDARFMFRAGKPNAEAVPGRPGAQPMVMGGRKMRGMVFVDARDCAADALQDWVVLALEHARTLPAKG